MSLLDWLTKRKKPLSQMSRAELRRQELLLEKDRTQLLTRVSKLAGKKQDLFDRGATERAPEVRRMFAQEFELMTSEQLMLARQLNIRSKEMMTVSRLRMIRENADRTAGAGSRLGLVSEKDLLTLGKLIENDAIKTDLYQERLDDILKMGAEVDEGLSGLSQAGETVMQVWDQMDRGAIADSSEGFQEADRRVRQQQTAAPEA
jgi:hypothetical protein